MVLHLLGPELDYLTLIGELREYKSPRDKIRRLIKAGDIIPVRKGLYVLGPKYAKPYSSHILANLIYGPSYISGISALAVYGAVPEEVKFVLSRTIAKPKEFDTPVGKFVYRSCTAERYTCGLTFYPLSDTRQFLISSPEKALLEEIILETGIQSEDDIEMWLRSNRIDEDFVESLSIAELEAMRPIFADRRLNLLIRWLKKEL